MIAALQRYNSFAFIFKYIQFKRLNYGKFDPSYANNQSV